MSFNMPLSEVQLKEIHGEMSRHLGNDLYLYENSPYVALAFQQNKDKTSGSFYGSERLDLTSMEEFTKNFRLWNDIGNKLQRFCSDKMRFKMSYLTFPHHSDSGREPAFLLVSVGALPNCKYWDDEMHNVDEAGIAIIKKGLNVDQRPNWVRSNYPFCTNTEIMKHPGFNPELSKLVDIIIKERNPLEVS